MKLSAKTKRDVLYFELFRELLKIDPDVAKEVVFSLFMPTKRKFRADFLCPNLKLIVEVNGGQFCQGRHNRGGFGYETDLTKLNLAQSNGYKIIQFTYQMLQRGEHLKFIETLK